MNAAQLQALAERINGFEFEHPFTVHPDGSVTEPSGVWAPSVENDPDGDISIDTDGWSCITGLTGQYGYHGAVMHDSEFVGVGVVRTMLDMAEEAPVTFALVVVYDYDDDTDDNIVGWAIAYTH